MKKLTSILLSLLLIASTCAVLFSFTSFASPVQTVTAQTGGTAKVEDGVFSAVPYYGNSFTGWYNDSNENVSTQLSFASESYTHLTAKFTVYNQIPDGSFDAGDNALINYFNNQTNAEKYHTGAYSLSSVSDPTANAVVHGSNVMKFEPTSSAAGSIMQALTIPVTIEKNKDYAFTYSFYEMGETTFQTKIGIQKNVKDWASSAILKEYTLHWAGEGITTFAKYSCLCGENKAINQLVINNKIGMTAGKWTNVYLMFNSGDSSSIFDSGDTATVYIMVGTQQQPDAPLSVLYDNICFAEVGTSPMASADVKAEAGGTVKSTTVASVDPGALYYADSVDNVVSASNPKPTGVVVLKDTPYYSQICTVAPEYKAYPYYGNGFAGWYENDTLVTAEETVSVAGHKGLTAKFTQTNQIPDGDFENDVGITEWNKVAQGTVATLGAKVYDSTTDRFGAKGMAYHIDGNSLMFAKMPVTVEKNTKYFLQFNMKVDSYAKTTETGIPVFSMMIAGSDSGNNTWGYWPNLDSYRIAIADAEDASKAWTASGFNKVENYQISFSDIENSCGTGWLNFTMEIETGDDTTNSKTGNMFANSDTATFYLALGCNFMKGDIQIDNMSFYKDFTGLSFEHKESVKIGRVGIGTVAPGVDYSFEVVKGDSTAVSSVTLNGNTVSAKNGVYTTKLSDQNHFKIVCDGDDNMPVSGYDMDGNSLTEYNNDLYTTPVWSGDTVYQENVVFYTGRQTARLLYPIDSIVSVRSYDLSTYYVKGVDYDVVNGELKILPGSSIPVYNITPTVDMTEGAWASDDPDKAIGHYSEGTVYQKALSVTYNHSTKWSDGYQGTKQTSVEDDLDIFKKLRNGEPVHIVFYGDSMTSGWSISGGLTQVYTAANDGTTQDSGVYTAPYAPSWMAMFIEGLKKVYPTSTITYENLSLGGKDSLWGLNNFEARYALLDSQPDLFLIGWGINDNNAKRSVSDFKTNVNGIIAKVREKNPAVSVLLYGANCTNTFAKNYDKETLLGYETALTEIAAATENTAATKLTSIFFDVAASKPACDLFGNNFNHANDFGCRLYAQTLLSAMSKKYTSTAKTPAAPTLSTKDVTSVTLTPVAGNEYSMDGTTWQSSNVFGKLTGNTEYKFYQRVARTDDTFESAVSAVLTVKTDMPPFTLGDVNEDGKVDSDDAVLVLKHANNSTEASFSLAQTAAADVNGDSVITKADASLILKYAVGIITSFGK